METKSLQRIALSSYFFLSGLCFSTWASRIPTIKDRFNLNDAELGSVLLVMPLSALVGTVASGWLVSKFDSRQPLVVSFLFFALALNGCFLCKDHFSTSYIIRTFLNFICVYLISL